jgi:hypothetical protein
LSSIKSYRPTAPIVINLVALLIVLGGQAIALESRQAVKKGDIAPGAVTARDLAPGIVTNTKLGTHAVTGTRLANQAVTGRAIKPGSVHGRALAGTFEVPAAVPDADPITHENDFAWTSSGGTAACPLDAIRLNGGLSIQDSAAQRAFVQSTYPSSGNAFTWVGEISTDTGGASPAQLFALCLR